MKTEQIHGTVESTLPEQLNKPPGIFRRLWSKWRGWRMTHLFITPKEQAAIMELHRRAVEQRYQQELGVSRDLFTQAADHLCKCKIRPTRRLTLWELRLMIDVAVFAFDAKPDDVALLLGTSIARRILDRYHKAVSKIK